MSVTALNPTRNNLKLLISHFQFLKFLISNLLTVFSMKFSQKLVCIMLLVIAAFFAVGGAVLVNGSFMDRLSAAAEQEQSMHAMPVSYTHLDVYKRQLKSSLW